ncbi:T9SS type A sorting domain-containing protein [Hymenobacter persicinus]|uniref:T9SS type A sorting domain-containing protein n=1 Tax=Hymenobacter persicinus TaxID=2025506 RepID=A0A4Q5LAQ0_9BACT|nr:T9SS type A sorting domain-containing protein [Hymenobacter persicinus]RYU78049.1 T9SS type A sorting domain-containing protein [Hymenobacter persicinus]
MKKTLLPLAFLCGLGLSAQAQTKWILQNNTGTITTPPSYFSRQMHTVSDQVAWQLIQESVTGATTNLFTRTTNGGATWTFNTVAGANNYQAAGIHALDGNTAFVAQFGANGGGEIVKTTNGGATWSKSTTISQFAAPAGFNNWVYFFDANNGVSLGDPNGPGAAYFEIYTTSNGGTTWTRVPSASIPAPLDANEYGLVGSYCAVGNTIWAGTTHLLNPADANSGVPTRVLKSTDRGLTWTASAPTPLLGYISKIAFTDANNGIAFRGSDMISTTDGGATWTTQTYTGNFNHFDIDAVPGTNIIVSVGSSVETVSTTADYGSSYSTNNGRTWIDIDRGRYSSTVDFISRTVGYSGAQTDAAGAGGVYKASPTILANRSAELQKSLSVYPNPSASGVFNLQLSSGIKAGTSVRVFDAVGRQVFNQVLNATSVASQLTTVDLSKEKAGLYTLELRTDAGVAQQKLVIQ